MIYNFDYYRVFYSVAKHKNMTASVKEIYLSQPTISRKIQKLEEELGCVLFVRTKRGMELTPEGELLFQKLTELFEQLETVEERLKQIKDLKNGMIHISATEMTMQYCLLPYLKQFKKDYPGIRIKLSLGYPETLLSQLNQGQVDFSVFTTPITADETVTLTPLAEYDEVLIGGEKFKNTADRTYHLSELLEEPFILMQKGTSARNYVEQFFEECQVPIRPEYEVSSMPVIAPMVQANMGIGFVPSFYAQEQIAKGAVCKINLEQKLQPRQICLCTSNIYPQSVASQELIKRLLR